MSDQTQSDDFEHQVLRPLRRATIAVVIFLGLFLAWAALAELATTVRINGHLSSAQPSQALQHLHGGRIKSVEVALHDHIRAGDTIFVFEVGAQRLALADLLQRMAMMLAENQIICAELGIAPPEVPNDGIPAETLALARKRHESARETMMAKIASEQAVIDGAAKKSESLAQEIQITRERVDLHARRLSEMQSLAERGLVRQAQPDTELEQLLTLKATIAAYEAEQLNLTERARQARLAIDHLQAGRRADLSDRLGRNIAALSEMRAQAGQLRRDITDAVIRSPVSGMITALNYSSAGMVAGMGETLAVVTQPLETPRIELQIPVDQVDQIRTGMTGKLVFTTLPRRGMPEISVTLTAVATQATRDHQGVPTHYTASAEMSVNDIARARMALGPSFRVTTDMPVSALLEGRPTTLYRFLTRPFLQIFDTALESS